MGTPSKKPQSQGSGPKPAAPPKHPYEKMKRGDLTFFRVTETQAQLNLGMSVTQEYLNKGWIKPEDPALLQASPNGLSFNLVKPKRLVEERRRQNNERARKMEGFRDSPYVKETTKETTQYKGQEIVDRVTGRVAPEGGNENDG